MTKRILISVRIEEKDAEEIDNIVKKTGADLSSVVRDIIAGHFSAAVDKQFAEKIKG